MKRREGGQGERLIQNLMNRFRKKRVNRNIVMRNRRRMRLLKVTKYSNKNYCQSCQISQFNLINK